MSISCGCMDMRFIFLTLLLLTQFSQRGSFVSGGQWADHVPRGCSRLIRISRKSFAKESREWRKPMGRPCASWLQHVDPHLKEMGMGQASAWGDGQIEALRIPAESGRSDALLWCTPPYLIRPHPYPRVRKIPQVSSNPSLPAERPLYIAHCHTCDMCRTL